MEDQKLKKHKWGNSKLNVYANEHSDAKNIMNDFLNGPNVGQMVQARTSMKDGRARL